MSSSKRGLDVLQLKCQGGVGVFWTVEETVQKLALKPSPQPEKLSAPNRADFSSDSAFFVAFKSLANTANREGRKSAKEIERKK
jgi:hypothetical protein